MHIFLKVERIRQTHETLILCCIYRNYSRKYNRTNLAILFQYFNENITETNKNELMLHHNITQVINKSKRMKENPLLVRIPIIIQQYHKTHSNEKYTHNQQNEIKR